MRFNPEDWKRKSHENFEGAWHAGPSVLTPASHAMTYPCRLYKRAQAHPVFATINRLRETYMSLGFDEAENPVIIDEKDIYRQFGPEAMAVLDRVFYLGGLPRPNVGIARKQLDEINEMDDPALREAQLAIRTPLCTPNRHLQKTFNTPVITSR